MGLLSQVFLGHLYVHRGEYPMHITVDARMITKSGIGRYIQNLVVYLARYQRECTYTVVVNPEDTFPGKYENLKIRRLDSTIPIYSLREQIVLPWKINSLDGDLIHYPNFNLPLLNTKPVVLTVHDLIYYLFPDACPGRIGHLYARFMFHTVTRLARRIIAVSNYTKEDIAKHLGIRADKITVIHIGVDDMYRPVSDHDGMNRVRERYGIKGEYILYVGTHHPRKNLIRLLHAFSGLRTRGYQLVLTGKIERRWNELYSTVKRLALDDRVIFTDIVPEHDLPYLYSMASLFVYPSFYEGFGLPPLEAMACGTPVITSNVTSLPEVVGDGGILVDPSDTDAIRQKIDLVLSDRGLRDELVERGFKRVKLFNWYSTAQRTFEIYKHIIEK